jgi:hypothetical protein
MRTTLVIVAALAVAGATVPAALAHTEENPDACSEDAHDTCKPKGNHRVCTGFRDWLDNGEQEGTMFGLSLAEASQSVGAYVHTGGEGAEDDPRAGLLYLETNGFDGFQKDDWKCKSGGHEDPSEWIEHPDQMIL